MFKTLEQYLTWSSIQTDHSPSEGIVYEAAEPYTASKQYQWPPDPINLLRLKTFEVVSQAQNEPLLLSRAKNNDTTRVISAHSPLAVLFLLDSAAVQEHPGVSGEKKQPQPGNQVHDVEPLVPVLFVFCTTVHLLHLPPEQTQPSEAVHPRLGI